MASERGQTAVVEQLLKRGGDLKNLEENSGAGALHLAAREGHLAVVQLLLSHGADARTKDHSGRTALVLARSRGHTTVGDFLAGFEKNTTLVNSAKGTTPAGIFVATAAPDVIATILKNGMKVNATNELGETLLTQCSSAGNLEGVKFLLGKKALVNLSSQDGTTALIAASRAGHRVIVETLLHAKADPHMRLKHAAGHTAKVIAANGGFTEIVAILDKAGAREHPAEEIVKTTLAAGHSLKEISGQVHRSLRFLDPNVRFFVSHPEPVTSTTIAALHVLLPGGKPVEITKTADLVVAVASISTPLEALLWAQFLSDPERLPISPALRAFSDSEVSEISAEPACRLCIARSEASSLGIKKAQSTGSKAKGFRVTRYAVKRSLLSANKQLPAPGTRKLIKEVTFVRDEVRADGTWRARFETKDVKPFEVTANNPESPQ